jgi:hypothetical protein
MNDVVMTRTARNGGGIQVPFLVIGVMNYDPAMPVVYMALLVRQPPGMGAGYKYPLCESLDSQCY